MGEDLRAEIKAACEASDRLNAEFERDEWLRARQRARQSAPAGVDVEEWLASRPVAKLPRPAPQQPSTTLDPETQAKWDRWCDRRIAKMIGPRSNHFNAIAEAISLIRRQWREEIAAEAKKLREEISGLRIDEVVGRSVLRGEINELREAGAKKKART